MNECSFSVNYDKTVFILIHVRRAEGSRARNGYGWGYARGVRCDARVRRGSSRPAERVTAASGSILTVGQSAEPRRQRERSGAGAEGGAVFLRHGSERDDGDGDGDVE
ncbi:hypothetical protein EVAR_77065_1 [Eumeta japonica]|uniref:Uncharacterized protein n=1 Tax=Eumeta variegata TaxID=151549 RepID=A0A4C2AAT9_EUMVA|nr:hypothetical protein EVAR_77065_1 [Eumeta japonica]